MNAETLRKEFKETFGKMTPLEEIFKINSNDYIKWLEERVCDNENNLSLIGEDDGHRI